MLSNHDRPRHVTRYGGGALGLRRARAAALLQLALPGAAYLYNGDELGMPDVDLPDEVLQDPVWERSGHTERGRDACRVPMPWSGTEPAVRVLRRRDDLAADARGLGRADRRRRRRPIPASMQSLYRSALALRSSSPAFAGESLRLAAGARRAASRSAVPAVWCAWSTSPARPMPLPEGRVLLASADVADGTLPDDAAVWLQA